MTQRTRVALGHLAVACADIKQSNATPIITGQSVNGCHTLGRNEFSLQMRIVKLEERPKGTVLLLATLQWFVFSLANMITVPIVLAHAFSLSPSATALYAERTFFVCGLIGLLQALFGHRYPVIEGPAGMWWGVFVVLIGLTQDAGGSLVQLQQGLELGLLVGGMTFVLLAVCRAIGHVTRLFTPIVTGTFLILLSMQLAKSLTFGVLGIGFQGSPRVQPEILLFSVALISFTIFLMVRGRGLVKSLAVLIGLTIGWIAYAIAGLVQIPQTPAPILRMPDLLPFGPLRWQPGIIITCVLTALILLSNLIASIQAFAHAAGEQPTPETFSRGTLVTGIGTMLTGAFGVVGAVPLATSSSLVSLTGIAARLPFVIASGAIALVGLFPRVGQWISTLPAPVGYAILFTVFGQLLGFGLRDIKKLELDQRDLFVVSLSLMLGVGILFVPGRAWDALPAILGYLLDNGLIVGVGMVLILEHVVFRRRVRAHA